MRKFVLTPLELQLMTWDAELREDYMEKGRQILEERGCFTVDLMSPEQLMRVALFENDRPR